MRPQPFLAALLLSLAACGQVQETVDAAPVAAGLVARTLCTAVFLQGRTEEDVRLYELGPKLDKRLGDFKADIDRQKGEVSAGPLGLAFMTAGHKPGLGCAVGRPGDGAGRPLTLTPDPRPWPQGDSLSPPPAKAVPGKAIDAKGLDLAIADAFKQGAYGNPEVDPVTRSIVIVHEGRLIRSVHARGFHAMTPQYSASMAKTVSAALVGILAAEGKISPGDKGLLPEWTANAGDPRAGISVDNLLNMESGLDFNEDYGAGGDPARMLYAENSAALFAAGKPRREAPGSRFYYSSGDTNILMRVARLKSGLSEQAWNQFPRAALFQPMGLRTAVFEQDAEGDFIGSTFLFMGAHDWARFGLMLADGGQFHDRQILPAEWVERMSTPTALSGGRYSTQTWFRGGVPGQKGKTLELAGFGGQYVTIVPETRTVIVRLGFQPDRSAWDQQRFLKRVFEALHVEAPAENRAD
ncbi:beta-lactamase family protein [Sandaracinobacter sp. RS1-74]|uniref:serine hydrolase domain-containing protein n=1 Tax=Sandaracinobacteroides sayramensis TaxID=2913411 RepID=UPI001EDA25E2|nr:serine hydrolase [Sandaracinobacteroides sayramensis]MCG2839638.1 beta-lactamase family protein [Sandaracinobacteroides sayramensis]